MEFFAITTTIEVDFYHFLASASNKTIMTLKVATILKVATSTASQKVFQ